MKNAVAQSSMATKAKENCRRKLSTELKHHRGDIDDDEGGEQRVEYARGRAARLFVFENPREPLACTGAAADRGRVPQGL